MTTNSSNSANHLIHETSPYLLQHAHNPVEWYPWGEEALGRARRENKPIFLSIGYAACHWCHVMERESFENEAIAQILNEHFISIKVDREERPDLDDLYMQAVQLLTGSGGWPMSVFLTPEGKPFFGGTYFPPEDRYGHTGFGSLLIRINEVYRQEQDKVQQNGDALTAAIAENTALTQQSAGALTRELVEHAIAGLRALFDHVHGGFGGAPKFPPSMAMNLLLREYSRTQDSTLQPLLMLTLQKMARGGMYDQLGGGFHRYSTDTRWLAPHFEKMLYDNALLAPVYFDAALVMKEPEFERIGREILDWVLADMQDEAGGFHSTLDADSEGVEGKFYTWLPAEVLETLTASGFSKGDAERFLEFYDISPHGNWHEAWEGGSIPNIRIPFREFGGINNLEPEQTREAFDLMRQTLLQVRSKRVPPGKDDKVLASWNGLMITALARGAQVTGDKKYLMAAQRAAAFILKQMRNADGGLLHSWRHGVAKIPGLLEDYACVIRALVDLYETDFDSAWLAEADKLAQQLMRNFFDVEHGGFYTTDGKDASVLIRMKDYYDGATPSGNSVAAQALMRLGLLLHNDDYRTAARGTMESIVELLVRQAPAHHNMLCAVDDELSGWREVAVIGDLEESSTKEALAALWRNYLPAKVMACAPEDEKKSRGPIAVLADKKSEGPGPTIYICRNYTCAAPVKNVQAMLLALN